MAEKKIPPKSTFVRKNIRYSLVLNTKKEEKTWTLKEIEIVDITQPTDSTLVIPDTRLGLPITEIKLNRIKNPISSFQKVILGKNIKSICVSDFCFHSSPKIQVKPGSSFYSKGSCLYDQSGKLLNYFHGENQPVPKEEHLPVSVPKDLFLDEDTLVALNHPVDTLRLPPQVTWIDQEAFTFHVPRRIECYHIPKASDGINIENGHLVKELLILGEAPELSLARLSLWPRLEGVYLETEHPDYVGKDGMLYKDRGRELIYIPPYHPKLKDGCMNVPEGVTHLADDLFRDRAGLKEVIMSDEVLSIGGNLFQSCEDLTKVRMSDSITHFPTGPSGSELTYQKNEEFQDLFKAWPFHLLNASGKRQDRITYLPPELRDGSNVFRNCTKLKELHLPRRLKNIGSYCFYHCGLTQLTPPETLEEIGEWAFAFSSLRRIHLPRSLKRVGEKAFYYTEHLTIQAYEGSAKGLLAAINPFQETDLNYLEVLSNDDTLLETLPIPVDHFGTLAPYYRQAWDGDQLCFGAYAKTIPLVEDEEIQEKMAMQVLFHLSKEEGMPYRKYIHKTILQIGEELVRQQEERKFKTYLDLFAPNKTVQAKLLQLCNQQGSSKLIALLLEKGKGNGPTEQGTESAEDFEL